MVRLLISIVLVSVVLAACADTIETNTSPLTTTSNLPTTSEPAATVSPTTTTAQPTFTHPYVPTDIDPNYIVIAPKEATITSGQVLEFTATCYQNEGPEINISFEVDYTIDTEAGGYWDFNNYVSENPGTWKVTGTYQHPSAGCVFWTDSTTLTVEADEPAPAE